MPSQLHHILFLVTQPANLVVKTKTLTHTTHNTYDDTGWWLKGTGVTAGQGESRIMRDTLALSRLLWRGYFGFQATTHWGELAKGLTGTLHAHIIVYQIYERKTNPTYRYP